MNNIIERLKEEYESGTYNISPEEEKELNFLTQFLSKIDLTDYRSIIKLDRKEFFLAVLCCINLENTKFTDIQKETSKLCNLDSINDSEYFHKIIEIILKLKEKNALEELTNILFLEDSNSKIEEIVNKKQSGHEKIYQNNLVDDLSNLYVELTHGICKTEKDWKAFVFLLTTYPNEIITCLIGIFATLTIKDDILQMKTKHFDPKKFNIAMKERLEKSNLLPTLSLVLGRRNSLLDKKNNLEKKKRNKEKRLLNIINELEKKKNLKTIELSANLISLIEDENIKFALLYRTLLHNKKTYLETKEKLEEEDNLSTLEKIFKKDGFYFDGLNGDQKKLLIEYGNFYSIEKMLDILKEKQFDFLHDNKEMLVEILLLGNPAYVSSINKLLTQDLLSPQFVINNPNIFYDEINPILATILNKENGTNTTLLKNINNLKERKIKTKDISLNNPNILLLNNQILEEKFSCLKKYDLNYQDAKRLDLIEDENLVKYIDLFIELGLKEFICNNIELINSNCRDIINRIILCKNLGIDIKDKKILENITKFPSLRIGKLVISKDTIEDCLIDASYLYLNSGIAKVIKEKSSLLHPGQEIDRLAFYKTDEYTYNINGVLISKNKVERCLDALKDCSQFSIEDKIFNALIFGSILDNDSLDKIKEEIFGKKKILKR